MARLIGSELESRILVERDGVLAVDKCPKLTTSGRSLGDEDCLQYTLIKRHGAMVWAVHQLDADTSGVNLFTTEKKLVPQLQKAMRGDGAIKRYTALVHGLPTWDETTCHARIGPVDERSLGVTPEGREADTHFEVIARGPAHSVLRVTLGTGRTHQVRIHLSHLGHPLVGEEWYRDPPCTRHPRQALHARILRLAAPFEIVIVAPVPHDMIELGQSLGLASNLVRL